MAQGRCIGLVEAIVVLGPVVVAWDLRPPVTKETTDCIFGRGIAFGRGIRDPKIKLKSAVTPCANI
jgi:hypothetical protein